MQPDDLRPTSQPCPPRVFAAMLTAIILLVGLPHTEAALAAPEQPASSSQDQQPDFPALSLPDLQGRQRSLDEWRGKVILLNFWASWCAPCQYEIPDFVSFQREYGDAGLQVIGVGVDARRPLANVARSLGINYPVLVAGMDRGKLLVGWGNRSGSIPYSVVIGRDGQILRTRVGRFDRRAFDRYVKPLLAPTPPKPVARAKLVSVLQQAAQPLQ